MKRRVGSEVDVGRCRPHLFSNRDDSALHAVIAFALFSPLAEVHGFLWDCMLLPCYALQGRVGFEHRNPLGR